MRFRALIILALTLIFSYGCSISNKTDTPSVDQSQSSGENYENTVENARENKLLLEIIDDDTVIEIENLASNEKVSLYLDKDKRDIASAINSSINIQEPSTFKKDFIILVNQEQIYYDTEGYLLYKDGYYLNEEPLSYLLLTRLNSKEFLIGNTIAYAEENADVYKLQWYLDGILLSELEVFTCEDYWENNRLMNLLYRMKHHHYTEVFDFPGHTEYIVVASGNEEIFHYRDNYLYLKGRVFLDHKFESIVAVTFEVYPEYYYQGKEKFYSLIKNSEEVTLHAKDTDDSIILDRNQLNRIVESFSWLTTYVEPTEPLYPMYELSVKVSDNKSLRIQIVNDSLVSVNVDQLYIKYSGELWEIIKEILPINN